MVLECRIPISCRPDFLNRTRLLAASIRQFYPDAIVRVYLGEPGGPTPGQIEQAQNALAGMGVEWINGPEFDAWKGTRSPYLATMNRRFKTPVAGDHVLILDADVLCTARFDELFKVDAVQGVQAHIQPIGDGEWRSLFYLSGMGPPQFKHVYSGGGIMAPRGRLGPFYPNSGVVFAPRHLFERLCKPYQESIHLLRGAMPDTYWFDQLALALAAAKAGVPVRSLPLRYNFPNQAGFDYSHPAELADVRFIHYLRTDIVHRDHDFADVAAMARLVHRRGLDESNERLRLRVAELMTIFGDDTVRGLEDAPYA